MLTLLPQSAVSSLRFNRSGSLLASGGRDTDVVVWDVVGESGLFRLRGHRDEVTDLAFVSRGNRLISCSKDTHLRVWDLDTQHCSQTVVGHRAAVWALDLDVAERRLVTGCADAQLRVFALQDDEEGGVDEEGGTLLAPLGSLARPGTDRVCALRFDPTGAYLAVAPAGRLVELWSVHSKEEAARRLRRRRKRKREKGAAAAAATEEDSQEETLPTATDEFSLRATLPLKHKALALAFSPKPGRGSFATLAITLASNCAETYDLVDGEADAPAMPQKAAEVSMAGHRADVRAIALADDDAMLVSTSHAGAKVRPSPLRACRGASF
jgi:U3 small nucleolar RNA-associated protein 12